MEKRITDLVFILDESGSMAPLCKGTIDAFNGMLETQRSETFGDDAFVTMVTFNDRASVVRRRTPIQEVAPLTEKDYYPNGRTALNDALGQTIHLTDELQTEDKAAGREVKTLVVTITDGLENASREYSRKNVHDLVSAKKECGWEFVFLGSEFDVDGEGETLGFSAKERYAFDHDLAGMQCAIDFAQFRACEFRMESDLDEMRKRLNLPPDADMETIRKANRESLRKKREQRLAAMRPSAQKAAANVSPEETKSTSKKAGKRGQ